MKLNEISDLVQNALEDMKAVDIVAVDVTGKSSMTDKLYIATGNSTRHVKSIAENVVIEAKKAGLDVIGTEGKGSSEWVLVDLNDVIVHVMLETTREFYQLEKLWAADDANDKSVEQAVADKNA
ncbi:ribosome silencing factor [Cocleimonas flava]|uniref:Ribosomal silencing factor RsfS n=1 Tax=Cocleimonas flava TaxID=634765 RepID=A0A4R1EZL1_9GAMM|nr:ribosome silencing factor [Cocleimonas flava]TCJ86933.1 ribosome-associated protein [Cocleimonas flava]